tara:strand:+ start:340 stop:513 length:174 start_codon:yes stop_codon:yes gene_type:complete
MLHERVTISRCRQARSDPDFTKASLFPPYQAVFLGEGAKASPGVIYVKREASDEGLK